KQAADVEGLFLLGERLTCLAEFTQRDRKRRVAQIRSLRLPRTGKAVDVSNRARPRADDVGKAFEIASQNVVLDERLLAADVVLVPPHGESPTARRPAP